jgi:hypothetical protein
VAYKAGSTTPIRLCMNSASKDASGKSVNDCLLKGPAALTNLFTITLSFREHKFAAAKDISKFYNSVKTDDVACNMCRVLWREGKTDEKPKIYVTTTVNFGDKPAGLIAIAAVRETAERFGQDFPRAAYILKNRIYVDDVIFGASTKEELTNLSDQLDVVVKRGGFKFKDTAKSQDPRGEKPLKVLGLFWDTCDDLLHVDVKINFEGKKQGAYNSPCLDLEQEVGSEDLPEKLTKRIVWRVVQGIYDPLGLLSPFTIQLKLLMRQLCDNNGQATPWDQEVPSEVRDSLARIVAQLKDLKKIRFPRSIQPTRPASSKPILMIFGDGSRDAVCAVAYARWELEGGGG